MNDRRIRRRPPMTFVTACLLVFGLLAAPGCLGRTDRDLVVYTALDKDFSEPMFEKFQEESKVRVLARYDVESTKTVGLVNRLIEERDRPRCDVFWNNEILHTLRLRKLGLLAPYVSPAAENMPANYRSRDGHWCGLAARARVLIVNTDLVPEDDRPTRVEDLADPKWKGKVGIAKPLFGTTATHFAVLYSRWGSDRTEQFFLRLKENARIVSGNKQVAVDVAVGRLAFGLTDTDDAIIEIDQGRPVEIVYPDQDEGEMGTLFIPNTIALIKGSENNLAAKELIDYVLSADVERALAEGRSAQFPLNPAVQVESRAAPSEPVRWMDVDFEDAAEHWDQASEFLREHLATAG